MRFLAELKRFNDAVSLLKQMLFTLDRDQVASTLGEEPAKIFEFHLGLLSD